MTTPFLKRAFVCLIILFSATGLWAVHYTQTIGSSVADAGLTSSSFSHASGATYDRSASGDHTTFAANDVTIYYTTATPTTDAAIGLDTNTLDITGSPISFAGDHAAARLTLINNGTSAADASGLNLNLTNNTTTLNSTLQYSTGSVYGALLQTSNSPAGIGQVQNNQVQVSAPAKATVVTPNLIGGAIEIDATTRNIVSQANVISNQVTVNTTASNKIATDIIGGKASANLHANHTYNLTDTVDSNSVTLSSGTFSGVTTGGLAQVSTDGVYNVTWQGNIQNNQVTAAGGTYDKAVLIGGHAALEGKGVSSSSTLPVSVHDNTVSVTGGTFKDTLIIGGATTKTGGTQDITGAVTGNRVEISGAATFQGKTTLVGGYTTGTNSISGNTLSLQTSGLTVYGVSGFDTYEFDVSAANAGDTVLTVTHGNGHAQDYFLNYEKSVKNSALDLTNATMDWQTAGRPANLSVGQSVTLINQTGSVGTTGTITGAGVQTDIVDGTETYSYKLVQTENAVHLLHNGLNTTGNWTQNVNLSAGDFAGGDSFMTVGGTLNAASVSVASNANAAATLTAGTLDVSTQDTALALTNTQANQVHFDTISIGNGHTLTKTGNGFYNFDNMTITGTGTLNTLDAFNATNTVTLSGATPTFNQINLGAGSTLTVSGGTYDFNTLTTYGTGATLTGDLNANGKTLNFYLADTTAAGDTALTVTGAADVTDSIVAVGITGTSSPLQKDDQVILVQAGSAITGTPATQTGVGMQGLFLSYDFDVAAVNDQLIATVTKAGLNKESKSFLEGRAAALGTLNQGTDLAANGAMESALRAAATEQSGNVAVFSALGGGASRYKTGSHVDVNGFTATVGLAHDTDVLGEEFMLASFAEYGLGSYHTYNTFASGDLKGSGNTDYLGFGALGRWLGRNNMYIEASARTGRISTDFKAHVFFANQNASYDYNTQYYGAHAGLGYLYDGWGDTVLDMYVKCLFTQQRGKEVTLSSGDRLRFKDSNSLRARTGIKANLAPTANWQPYIGLAYDYEFAGKANATAYNMSWDAPSLKGGSAVGEVSLAYERGDWSFALGAEGYAGQRQGFGGNFQVGYKF